MNLQEFFIKIGVKVDQADITSAQSAIAKIGTGIKAVGKVALGLGVAGIGAVLGLGSLVESTSETSAEISKLSLVMGVSVETAQEWAFAFNKTGVSINDFTELAAELAENVGEAAGGTGEAADSFKSLGIKTKDSSGKLKQVDVLLLEIADSFQKLSNGQKKTSAATGLFGESGLKLLPTLNKGSEGIQQFMDQANDLGVVLGTETIQRNSEFNAELKDLTTVFNSLKMEGISAVIPVLKELGEEFLNWYVLHKKEVQKDIREFFEKLSDVLLTLIDAIKLTIIVLKFLSPILKFTIKIIRFVIDYWKLFALGVVAATAALVIFNSTARFVFVNILFYLSRMAIAFAPIILKIMAVAAIVAALYVLFDDIWVTIKGGDSVIRRLYDSFYDFLGLWVNEPGQNWLESAFKKTVEYLLNVNGIWGKTYDAYKGMFTGLFDYLDSAFTSTMNAIIAGLNYTLDYIPGYNGGTISYLQTSKQKDQIAQSQAVQTGTDEDTMRATLASQQRYLQAPSMKAFVTSEKENKVTPFGQSLALMREGKSADYGTKANKVLSSITQNKNTNTANININGTGLNSQEIADKVKLAFEDSFGPILRQTKAGVE